MSIYANDVDRRNVPTSNSPLNLPAELRHYRLFEPVQDGVLLLDAVGCVLYLNPAAARILRKPREALIGAVLWESLSRALGSNLESELRASVEAQEAQTFRVYEASLRTWLQGRTEPTDEGVCLYLQDVIAGRPIAEVVENIEEAFALLDRGGNYVYVNHQAARMSNCAPEDLIGKNGWELYPKSKASPIYDAVCQVFETQKSVHLETIAPTLGLTVDMSFYPQGEYVAIFSRDITARKAAEIRLLEREQEFRFLFELSAVGKAQVDADTYRFLRVNQKFCEMTGYTAQELTERTFADITFHEDREVDKRRYQVILAGSSDRWTAEKRYVHKDGHLVWVQVDGSVIRDTEGRVVRSMASILDITGRKQAEESLRRSEERFSKAFAASPDGLAITRESDGLIREANGSFLNLLGVEREKAIGKRSTDLGMFVEPGDREKAIAVIQRDGYLRDYETTIHRASGELRIVRLSAERMETNAEPSLLTILRDVTEQKRLDERYRGLFASMQEGLLLTEIIEGNGDTGVDFRYVDLNPAAERLLGVTREQIIGTTARGLIPEVREDVLELYAQVARTGEPLSHELFEPMFQQYHHNFAFRPAPGQVAVLFWDITERKATEEAITRRVKEIEAIMNAVPVAICIAQDPECRLITGNAWAHRLMRAPQEATNLTKTGPPEENLNHFTVWREGRQLSDAELPMQHAANTGEDVRDWEIELRFADGSATPCLGNASPLYDADGKVRGAVGAFVDITEQKQRQTEIEGLNEKLRRSIRETHHRVKNNLQVIAAMLDMQTMQYQESVPAGEVMRVRQHINALAAIHDLLTHKAKDDAEVYALSVRDALLKLLPMLQAMVEGREIVLSVEDVLLPIRQATTLTVLVNELVSNAVKHGKGQVCVRFALETGEAVLEVSDEGPGFPHDFALTQSANTGLDLVESLSRYDLSGSMRYENKPEGGARVSLRFPPASPERTAGEK